MRVVDVDDRLAAEPRPATAATEGDLRVVRRFFGMRGGYESGEQGARSREQGWKREKLKGLTLSREQEKSEVRGRGLTFFQSDKANFIGAHEIVIEFVF
jgi:hypothetical protein